MTELIPTDDTAEPLHVVSKPTNKNPLQLLFYTAIHFGLPTADYTVVWKSAFLHDLWIIDYNVNAATTLLLRNGV